MLTSIEHWKHLKHVTESIWYVDQDGLFINHIKNVCEAWLNQTKVNSTTNSLKWKHQKNVINWMAPHKKMNITVSSTKTIAAVFVWTSNGE